MSERHMYDRQADESPKAFAGFGIYLSQGAERSLARVGQEYGRSRGLIERWSSRHHWTDRAAAYDADQAEHVRRALLRSAAAIATRQARIGARMLAQVEAALDQLDAVTMKPADVTRMAEAGARLELAALALPNLSNGASSDHPSRVAKLLDLMRQHSAQALAPADD